MTGKAWGVVGVVCGALALAGCEAASHPQAGQQAAQADSKQPSSSAAESLQGHVLQKEGDHVVLQVPERGRFTVYVTDKSEILVDGKKASLKRIPEGAEARASYEFEGKKRVATRIDATSATGGSGAGHN